MGIVQEGEVLIHPEPLWSHNGGVLNELTQDQQDVVGPVLRRHQLLDFFRAQGALQYKYRVA